VYEVRKLSEAVFRNQTKHINLIEEVNIWQVLIK